MELFFSKNTRSSETRIARFLLEIVRNYFRLEVEGIENVPAKGGALIIPNHSGVTALDAVMIGNEIFRSRKRIPKILAHPLWFVGPNLRILAKRIGLEEASKDAGMKLLRKNKLVILFPEGAAGNFKPTAERYHLQEFRRGFVRMAMVTKAPIIPTVVIGAEETNINLSSISLTKYLRGTVIPLPLNVLPLPAKWKIVFMKPISMARYSEKHAADHDLVHRICEDVRGRIQERIREELKKRDYIYFPHGG
ncbi:MAG: acyltransferase family protein [Bdellovibrionales bacterium]|nr:acyltransferase family protein [Bdellovibrionales bacterium]